jgi:hypothetical protein
MTSFLTLRVLALPKIRQRRRPVPLTADRRRVCPIDSGRVRLREAWRTLCASNGIVLFRPRHLSAIALIVAVIAATSSTLIADCTQPAVCPMQHQECDRATKITDCCCGHASDASRQGGPLDSSTVCGDGSVRRHIWGESPDPHISAIGLPSGSLDALRPPSDLAIALGDAYRVFPTVRGLIHRALRELLLRPAPMRLPCECFRDC